MVIPRQAVVVLGMHRSGTSAVAGAAIRLGLAPPRTPLAPTQDNPTGFHEAIPIDRLNDLLLKVLGCNWFDCLAFDPDSLDHEARLAAFNHCREILLAEFGDAPAFVVKDPQLCMTLPLWLPPLRALGAGVSILLVVRHPEEVARSLFRRDQLAESDTAAVWLHHLLEAERMTRELPRAVLFYAEFLNDWRGSMARAGHLARIDWPAPQSLVQSDDGSIAIPSLRHHWIDARAITVGASTLRPMIADAWDALWALRDDPARPTPQAMLDDVRTRFVRWRKSPQA